MTSGVVAGAAVCCRSDDRTNVPARIAMRMFSASAFASSLFFRRRPSSTSRLNRHARPPRGLKLKCQS